MYDDPREVWWRNKYQEQMRLLHAENDALREKLADYYDSFIIIEAMKKHLTTSGGEFHSILKHFQPILNTIFGVADDALAKVAKK